MRGADLVSRARWGEALREFEQSARLKPHPVTSYNIGACQRALGKYTRARASLRAALEHVDGAGDAKLADSMAEEVRAQLTQIDALLARVNVDLEPASARISVDGRPLKPMATEGDGRPLLIAGVLKPGKGKAPPAASFSMLVDPGAHVITLARKGFDDIVLNRTFKAGTTTSLPLKLHRLAGELHVDAELSGARVMIDGKDVGYTPVDVPRPAGSYVVLVEKEDRVPWESHVTLEPGERVALRAPLPEREPTILEKWWFWTAAGVVASAAVTVTYFATRPEPTRPAAEGGGLNWVIRVE